MRAAPSRSENSAQHRWPSTSAPPVAASLVSVGRSKLSLCWKSGGRDCCVIGFPCLVRSPPPRKNQAASKRDGKHAWPQAAFPHLSNRNTHDREPQRPAPIQGCPPRPSAYWFDRAACIGNLDPGLRRRRSSACGPAVRAGQTGHVLRCGLQPTPASERPTVRGDHGYVQGLFRVQLHRPGGSGGADIPRELPLHVNRRELRQIPV